MMLTELVQIGLAAESPIQNFFNRITNAVKLSMSRPIDIDESKTAYYKDYCAIQSHVTSRCLARAKQTV